MWRCDRRLLGPPHNGTARSHTLRVPAVQVSLFETNIRVLGGLLSAHLLASGQLPGAEHLTVDGYRGELLRLAVDVGERLLSAFDGCSKLPRAFVRLCAARERTHARRARAVAVRAPS